MVLYGIFIILFSGLIFGLLINDHRPGLQTHYKYNIIFVFPFGTGVTVVKVM